MSQRQHEKSKKTQNQNPKIEILDKPLPYFPEANCLNEIFLWS